MADKKEITPLSIDLEASWPHYDNYLNKCACGRIFGAPKRAPCCWICASVETKEWWEAKHKACSAAEKEHG